MIDGGGGNDRLDGGNGDDRISSHYGIDRIDGGSGSDSVSIDRSYLWGDLRFVMHDTATVTKVVGDGTLTVNVEQFDFRGGSGDDIIATLNGNDRLDGGYGNDRLSGGGGNDFLSASAGVDRLDGGNGNDRAFISYWSSTANLKFVMTGFDHFTVLKGQGTRIINVENVEISTGSGNDIITTFAGDDSIWGGGGIDRLDGGAGDDLAGINCSASLADLRFVMTSVDNVTRVHGEGTTVINVENIYFFAGDGDDIISTLDGADTLYAGRGNDKLWGGDGDDVLVGGEGDDMLFGGAGNDFLENDYGADRLDGGADFDSVYIDLSAMSVDLKFVMVDTTVVAKVIGSGTTVVNAEQFEFYAGSGDDIIATLAGDDYLDGGEGNDRLLGGAGNDVIIGGSGRDVMDGGAGDDIFIFYYPEETGASAATRDRINNFESGDLIDLSSMDADGPAGWVEAFTFIGLDRFTGTAGELRYVINLNNNTIISGDVNGDALADFQILLEGAHALTQNDFLL
jgi:Ca2+-binding RTX toxin-like protein